MGKRSRASSPQVKGDARMETDTERNDVSITIEPRIAVVGLGGGGCNIVSSFYNALAPVDTIAINTDKKALDETAADKRIYICKAVTKGEGTRGDAALGNKCARIHEDEIEKAVSGHDVVFLIAGLGGGTGGGAASVVADICSRLNILTIAVGINPFFFETDRIAAAKDGLRNIRMVCPNTFAVENDRILEIMPDATMNEAMRAVNKSIMGFVSETVSSLTAGMEEELALVRKVFPKKICSESIPNIRQVSEIKT